MSAEPVTFAPVSLADRKAALRQQLAALIQADWNAALDAAQAFERALSELDQDGIPDGVRQIARRLAKDVPAELQSMAAIMEKRK